MPEWANHPATIILAGLAVLGVVVTIARWTAAVDADRAAFAKFMERIQEKFEAILERLPPPGTVAGSSPLSLTKLGRKISEDLEAGKVADGLVPALLAQAEGKDAYSIQELCLEYVRGEFEPEEDLEIRIRLTAFENGLKREQILDVIAIELRDRLMQPASPLVPPSG